MDNITQPSAKTQKNVQAEVSAIKEDMADILQRLGSLRNTSKEEFSKQVSQFMDQMSDLGEQGLEMGRDYYGRMEACVRKRPMSSVGYAFAAGILTALLFKK